MNSGASGRDSKRKIAWLLAHPNPPLIGRASTSAVIRAAGAATGAAGPAALPCIIGGDTAPIVEDLLTTGTDFLICPAETDREAFLILDGNVLEQLQRGDMIEVHRGENRFRLIVPGGQSFYTAFQGKFNYLIRPEAKPTLGHFRADHDHSRYSPETTSRRRR